MPRLPRLSMARGVLGLAAVLALPPRADALQVAGDGHHLWVARAAGQRQLLLLHLDGDPATAPLRSALRLNGTLVPGGLAAAAGRLWLAYDDQTVQSIQIQSLGPGSVLYPAQYEEPLPRGAALCALACGPQQLWALVRVTDAGVLATLDQVAGAGIADPEGPDQAAPAPPDTRPELPPNGVHRLLRLDKDRWISLPLPADWPHAASAWAVLIRRQDAAPALVTAPATPGGRDLRYYLPGPDGWQRHDGTLAGGGPIRVAAVDERFILAHQSGEAATLVIQLVLLRPEAVTPLGTVELDGAAGPAWTVVPLRGTYPLGVVAWDAEQRLRMVQVDWEGRSTPAAPLHESNGPRWSEAVDHVVLGMALALATLIMFLFWRRDADWNRLTLPPRLAVADLARRALAGAIDLVPSVALVYFWFDVTPEQLLRSHWPGHRSGSVEAMAPGVLAIGLFCLLAVVSELLTARTLGKTVAGLRVVTLDGSSPRPRSILIRNAMKAVEMVAWFLLVLPAMSPSHQRLGDLLARTVVVAQAQREGGGSGSED